MNIFLVDKDPRVCAKALDDLRLNKMILETGQLLCNGFRTLYPSGPVNGILYKETHKNHPCSVWVGSSRDNYIWTLELFYELYTEKWLRTGRYHLSFKSLKWLFSFEGIEHFEYLHPIPLSQQPKFSFNCSGVNTGNVFDDYKICLTEKWKKDKRAPKWTLRSPPVWFSMEECREVI